MDRLMKGVTGEASIKGTFKAGRRPREIDPEKYQSRPSLPEVVPGAQSDSSPSGGDGDDGSRTVSAQHDGADNKPQIESSETRKRKEPSTGGDDRPRSPSKKWMHSSAASPAASAQSDPGGSATTYSAQMPKEQSQSGTTVVSRLLRTKKFSVKKSSHKPADFGIVDMGNPQTTKPVDEVSQAQPDL
ncbi:uncharacterized protein LOC120711659 [Panicum virgatum]|uniref:uncharacterized protein LOC120711659 n=1 Tax=Panicum virgatum TaxID=38727 RepID=UPI0019D4F535|nr:uncharacterized protein LOC120711659 [Panicum virgatum]